ncbi:MAG: hypothetical protein ACOYB0_08250 [Polynucleobacter sp.]
MTPTFPHDRLTLIFERGYTVEPDPRLAPIEFEDGYTAYRPTASRVPHRRKLKYRACTKADAQFFREWHRTELRQGAFFFLWRDPVSSEYRRARIMGGAYQMTASNSRLDAWIIEFELSTLE